MPILQGPARGMKWIVGSSVHGCWLGSYESEKQFALKRYLKPGMTVYDLGAHVGFYTLLCSHFVGDNGIVYAFEPFPENCKFLLKHIRLNHIANVVIVKEAVADVSGEITFFPHASSTMGRISRNNQTVTQESFKVPAVSLDDFVFNRYYPPPDLVKIDIEGAEGLACSGMSRLLEEKNPILFIALHGKDVADEVLAVLDHRGYRTCGLSGKVIDLRHDYTEEIIAIPPNKS